jgi:hypothetical protein
MATLDTQTISDIGGMGPDPIGAQAKALTLADLYDTNTLNKMKVSEAKQSQSDMTYAKQILADKDLSKLEDQNAAVAEITKRSPQLGMQLARDFSAQRGDKYAEQEQQLKLYAAKNDVIGSAVYSLKEKHDAVIADFQKKNPQATPQQLEQATHDAMKDDVISTLTQLAQAKLPDGSPLLNDQDKATIKRDFGNGYNTAAVNALVMNSQKAKEAIALKLKEANEGRLERATTAAITKGEAGTDIAERKLKDQEALASAKQKLAAEGKFTEDDARALAEQYVAGDKSVLTGLGRGAQGPTNIIMVRHAIAQVSKENGMKPADLAARLAEYQGYVSEQRALGTQQANVEMASSEAQQMIQNARGASDDTAIQRAHALGWNKIDQWATKELQGSDENKKLASLKAATTAVINTWARAINPKGVATVADKEHGYELLNAAQDSGTYNAVLDRFQQETEASLAAPASAKQRLHDAFISGQTPTPAPPPGPASLTGTPGRGAPPAGGPAAVTPPAGAGTVLKFDAQGNPIS